MSKNIQTIFLIIIATLIIPLSFYYITYASNIISKKNKDISTNVVSYDNKVPEESKKEVIKNPPPAADDKKVKQDDNKKSQQIEETALSGTDYTVKSGDTLFSISIQAYGNKDIEKNIDKIKKQNNLKDNSLYVGQKLKIPE